MFQSFQLHGIKKEIATEQGSHSNKKVCTTKGCTALPPYMIFATSMAGRGGGGKSGGSSGRVHFLMGVANRFPQHRFAIFLI